MSTAAGLSRGLSDLMRASYQVVMSEVSAGVVLSEAPDGSPVVIGLQVTERFGPPGCRVDVLAARQTPRWEIPCPTPRPASVSCGCRPS